jgi:hypothetical protein
MARRQILRSHPVRITSVKMCLPAPDSLRARLSSPPGIPLSESDPPAIARHERAGGGQVHALPPWP